jgi:hypothetical protein
MFLYLCLCSFTNYVYVCSTGNSVSRRVRCPNLTIQLLPFFQIISSVDVSVSGVSVGLISLLECERLSEATCFCECNCIINELTILLLFFGISDLKKYSI